MAGGTHDGIKEADSWLESLASAVLDLRPVWPRFAKGLVPTPRRRAGRSGARRADCASP